MTQLTLEIIKSYNFKERTYKPDWDDVAIDFTLPNELELTTLTVCCNEPVKSISMEGLDGYIYINTKEELDELLQKSFNEILTLIKSENPKFDKTKYEQ